MLETDTVRRAPDHTAFQTSFQAIRSKSRTIAKSLLGHPEVGRRVLQASSNGQNRETVCRHDSSEDLRMTVYRDFAIVLLDSRRHGVSRALGRGRT